MEKPKPPESDISSTLSQNELLLSEYNLSMEVIASCEQIVGKGGSKMDSLLLDLPKFDVFSEQVYSIDLCHGGQVYTVKENGLLEFSVTVEPFERNRFIGHEFRRIDNYLFLVNNELGMAFSGVFSDSKVINVLAEPQSKPYFGYEYLEAFNG